MQDRSAQEIWDAALGELQVQVSKQNYRTWLEKTVGLSYQDNEFTVGVPNTFVAEYLDKKQRSLIEKTLIGLGSRNIKVIFQANDRLESSPGCHGSQEPSAIPGQPGQPNLNPKYTFSSFIPGYGNRLARAAAIAVAENSRCTYNPLFIYGGVGLGKTHLLHAIGHAALSRQMKVLYASAERFTNEFLSAIRERSAAAAFRLKYRSADILLIDDIQFIGGKGHTEESFFHTFNELYNSNHQIAITSNLPPQALPLLHKSLCSRFQGGLVADIQTPDLETRTAILRFKAEQQGAQIPPDSLELIARQAQQSVRELEGLLNRVIAYSRLVRTPITPELTARAIETLTDKPIASGISPALVLDAVASSFHRTADDLKMRTRDKETVLARQIAMYLIRQEARCSLAVIGEELGGRDHSTVIHACDKITRYLDSDPALKRRVLDIQLTLHSGQKSPTRL